MSQHEDWTPLSVWWNDDTPTEAFERMANGGYWQIQEPFPLLDLSSPPDPPSNLSLRVASYMARWQPDAGSYVVFGQWRGDKGWQKVGEFRRKRELWT